MDLVEIYRTYKEHEFHYTPGVFVGATPDEDDGHIIFIDKKFISTLSDSLKRDARSLALKYKSLKKNNIIGVCFSVVKWQSLDSLLLEVHDVIVSDPESYDVRELSLLKLPELFLPVPVGFLICLDIKGAIIFHEPSSKNEETTPYFDDLYSYLSREYSFVEVQAVDFHVTDVFKEKILSRSIELENEAESPAQLKLMEILTHAVNSKVSDIHMYLLTGGRSYYQYRIYKRLQNPIAIGSEMMESVLRSAWRAEGSLVDSLFSVNKSQERTLQLRISQKDGVVGVYKFRFQTSPVEGGLKTVMRVINTDNSGLSDLSFSDFGYEDYQEHQIRMALNAHDGLVLVCGSTNSGKSTAISKMLLELVKLRPYWAIDSVEDPVENELKGIAQHPVSLSNVDNTNLNEKEARSEAFLRALMDLMRQDPDAINVGEIRDSISAETCRDLVNTGHKLFSTIHAKRIMGSFGRLAEIGMSNDDLCRKGFLTAVIYQSLIPTVCEYCALPASVLKEKSPEKHRALLEFFPSLVNIRVHNSEGCSHCRLGIKGLTVCAEILEPDGKFLQFIRDNNFQKAEEYWLEFLSFDNAEFDYLGRSLEDAIMYKVYCGVICPLVAEDYLLPLEYLGRNYSSKTLFPTNNELKRISNE